jgi:hypothetical protein
MTINEISNDTLAAIENTSVTTPGALVVSAHSVASIQSLGFGISIAVAVSTKAKAISATATGALSFNDIHNTVEATIRNDVGGTKTVSAGSINVTASDESLIEAIAIAASVSMSGSFNGTSLAVSIGLALAHNRIGNETTASIANVPGVFAPGGDISVTADDKARIKVVTVAAAVAVAIGDKAIGLAGGAAESTNIILSRTNAYIENSVIGIAGTGEVRDVIIAATSVAGIEAIVAGVAVSVAVGLNGVGVGVAVGIAVARNFIGWDPNANRDSEHPQRHV